MRFLATTFATAVLLTTAVTTAYVINVQQSQGEQCDDDNCKALCKYVKLNGTCDSSNHCECSFGQTCSTMSLTCQAACKILRMDGECNDQDMCECSAKPEWCEPVEECTVSCRNDPAAVGCLIVIPIACVEYGPVTFCSCECIK